MDRWPRYLSLLIMAVGIAACTGAVRTPHETVSRSDPALVDFYARVERYVKTRDTLRRQPPAIEPQTISVDPAGNQHARDTLAARIRRARAEARQGDIFTKEIATTIRRRLNPEVRGPAAADTRAEIRDDGPASFALRINEKYPAGAPFSTMPGNVLAVLPALPPGLEYRIVNGDLILRDTEADIIVDYLFDVMCSTC